MRNVTALLALLLATLVGCDGPTCVPRDGGPAATERAWGGSCGDPDLGASCGTRECPDGTRAWLTPVYCDEDGTAYCPVVGRADRPDPPACVPRACPAP